MRYPAPLARLALRRPVTIWMIFIAMLLLGLVSSRLLPLERFPGIDIPQLVVQVPYANTTPAESERLLTRPLEEALATIPNIKQMNSSSDDSGGSIILMFDWSTDINVKSIEVREQVDNIRHTLPDDLERIFIFHFNTDDMPILQIRISSEQDLTLAWDLLNKRLKEPLERLPGVSQVNLYGVEQAEITIQLDPERIQAAQLTHALVMQRLSQANFTLSGGHLETPTHRIIINASDEFHNLDDIRQLPITSQLVLGDLAEVSYLLPKKTMGRRFKQKPAIGLDIHKDSHANLVEVSRSIVQLLEEVVHSSDFQNIELLQMDNTADSVVESLTDLLMAGGVGALLSIAVLILFLREWRLTLIIVLSVPAAICLALGIMYLLGYSLNILSMMGLMLAIGMLIDNAVVVSESVRQEQEYAVANQLPLNHQIVEQGTGKVSLAIIAGTLTTAVVFLPNIFGEKQDLTVFLEHVAVAICISLLTSLLLAQSLIPLLLSKLKPKPKVTYNELAIKRWYLHSLRWSYHHPKTTTGAMLLIFLSTFIPLSFLSSGSMDSMIEDRLMLNYNIQGQYTLEEIEQDVKRIEAYLYQHQDEFYIQDVYSYYSFDHASSVIYLKEKPALTGSEIRERIRKNMPVLFNGSPQFGFMGGDTDGVQITLKGRSTDALTDLAEHAITALEGLDSLSDVQTANQNRANEIQVIVDTEKAHLYGFSVQDIATHLGTALRGQWIRSFRHHPDGDMRITVRYPFDYEEDINLLKSMLIPSEKGIWISLEQIAHFQQVPLLSRITRYDRETAIRIQANLDKDTALGDARKDITHILEQMSLPAGYTWSLDGGFIKQDQEQQGMIVNMLLAMCLIYMIMASLFESLLLPNAVIGSLILAICGAFWGLWITGQDIEIMGMMGMLILMGVVVNNGIVLIDHVNQLRHEGLSIEEALIQGTERRIRPILMTVITTVLGLLPLAIGSSQVGGDGPSYTSMAITIISGLIFSTLTSLYFVPHAYSRLLAWHSFWSAVNLKSIK